MKSQGVNFISVEIGLTKVEGANEMMKSLPLAAPEMGEIVSAIAEKHSLNLTEAGGSITGVAIAMDGKVTLVRDFTITLLSCHDCVGGGGFLF